MALPLILNSAVGFFVGMAYIGIERFRTDRAAAEPRSGYPILKEQD